MMLGEQATLTSWNEPDNFCMFIGNYYLPIRGYFHRSDKMNVLYADGHAGTGNRYLLDITSLTASSPADVKAFWGMK